MPSAARPLDAYLRVQRVTDIQLRRMFREAARDADAILRNLPDGDSADIRRAQLRIARDHLILWGRAGTTIGAGMYDAVGASAEWMAGVDEAMFRELGWSVEGWKRSLVSAAQNNVANLTSRLSNGYSLSESVYRNAGLHNVKIDRIINSALLRGTSAREIATQVARYISPSTPGGASYAALRLGRTELNNAFHRTAINIAVEEPWVEAMKWNLSGSHPRPDECNEYAEETHYRGGEAGVFRPEDVPGKPHPNCLCYVTPVTADDDELVRAFNAGEYDNYLRTQGIDMTEARSA